MKVQVENIVTLSLGETVRVLFGETEVEIVLSWNPHRWTTEQPYSSEAIVEAKEADDNLRGGNIYACRLS